MQPRPPGRLPIPLLLAIAGTSACVLVVPDVAPSAPHCAFAGGESECGACIHANCNESVDRCCQGDACDGVIVDVEGCATRGDASCTRLTSLEGRAGGARDVAACVATRCKQACRVKTAGNVTRCKPAYVTSRAACSCETSDAPNDVVCAASTDPTLRCCAPEGWPGPALSCDCLAIICVPLEDGCMCQLTRMDDQGRPAECKGPHCCADAAGASCTCRSTACAANETEVPACNLAALRCGTGRKQVESCSVAAP